MLQNDVLQYLNHPRDGGRTLAQSYGTENFAFFLYSILLMQHPQVVVELGTGAGTTAILAAHALHDNGRGHIWTVDSGSDWRDGHPLRQSCQDALGYEDRNETYEAFMSRLSRRYQLENYLSFVQMHLDEGHFFCPQGQKIDVLFADATPSDERGCICLLRYYLPKMLHYSSIFIDSASTIHCSSLLLNYLVEHLNRGRIPIDLLNGMESDEVTSVRNLVDHCSFSIVHITETSNAKRHNPRQNSRAWVRIEPFDHFHHNSVINYTTHGTEKRDFVVSR